MADEYPDPIRVRFAPSPTGNLHVGGVRTALFNYLFAQKESGDFILRIEDTDQERLVDGASEQIMRSLSWLGMTWDEGPYYQSQRLPLYKAAAVALVAQGNAYACFCTKERIAEVREKQNGYDRYCRFQVSAVDAIKRLESDEEHVIRLKVPIGGETVVKDEIRGDIIFQNEKLEDTILLKRDGFPTYHLANVVDDHYMEISHILRGEEWISTAPIHTLIYNALHYTMPKLIHLPLILAEGGGKLSKRHGATSIEEFRAQGYVPEALLNYLVGLGWSPSGDQELFSLAELKKVFDVTRISPAPAVFDYKKLLWFNQQYINHVLTLDELTDRILPILHEHGWCINHPTFEDRMYIKGVVGLYKDRLKLLTDVAEVFAPFFESKLKYEKRLLVPKGMHEGDVIGLLRSIHDYVDICWGEKLEEHLRTFVDKTEYKVGQIFQIIRVACVGKNESPGLFDTMNVLGKRVVLGRLESALKAIN